MPKDSADGIMIQTLTAGRSRAMAVNPGARFDLSWDRYRQLTACAAAVRDLLPATPKNAVLDVGGTDGALALFLPEFTVEILDCAIESGGMFQAEANSYDVVVSADVIEHLEPRQRGVFIAQMGRACKIGCVLNFPLPASSTAQKIVASITGDPRLNDHVRLGLPYGSTVCKHFEDMGFQCSSRQHTSRSLWATFAALQHCDSHAAAVVGRFLMEDSPDSSPGDPLYETVTAKKHKK